MESRNIGGQHLKPASSGIKNRTIFIADNLPVMRGMEDQSVDLIYLDPPFNSKHNYAAPIGSKAAGAEFKDTWTLDDVDIAWWGEIAESNQALYEVLDMTRHVGGKSAMSYLIYMAIRILEMHRILKSTGSLYLHCDPTMSHYLKMVLDAIFQPQNFKNEIIWAYRRYTANSKRFQREHDVILFYGADDKHHAFNTIYESYGKESGKMDSHYKMGDDGRWFRWQKRRGKEPYKIYLSDKGRRSGDVWNIPHINASAKERIGYPTQKPLALLERIIQASSDVGNVVFDPFCGCATTCLAAERQGRKWIGCDVSERAYSLIEQRLKADAGIAKFITGAGQVIHRTDIPHRKGRRSKDIKHTLYGIQQGHCNGCKYHYQFKDLEVDHIIPRAKGGQDDDKNLQLLCGNCNRRKGGKLTMTELNAVLVAEGMKFGKGRSNS